ncbi:hypothetical protein ACFC58_36235 [Kitasatospora purpeofusca]|uniref:hypothetical protein n=1 Tax=Kitasatospora purpeofusca TaxID=67352 RepID=UPI0035DC32DA
MPAIPGWLLRHRVSIEPYEGDGAYGPVYGTPGTVRAFVDAKVREVRSPTGEQVVSSSTAYCPPGTAAPPGSRVTLPDGRQTHVIAVYERDGGGLPTPDHTEIQLV